MANINIIIEAAKGKTAEERAWLLSEELFNISRPTEVKHQKDGTKYLFGVLVHPTTSEACLYKCSSSQQIFVNNKVNLNKLLAEFDKIPAQEKQALKDYIEANKDGYIPFINILPSTTIYITDAEVASDGWIVDDLI